MGQGGKGWGKLKTPTDPSGAEHVARAREGCVPYIFYVFKSPSVHTHARTHAYICMWNPGCNPTGQADRRHDPRAASSFPCCVFFVFFSLVPHPTGTALPYDKGVNTRRRVVSRHPARASLLPYILTVVAYGEYICIHVNIHIESIVVYTATAYTYIHRVRRRCGNETTGRSRIPGNGYGTGLDLGTCEEDRFEDLRNPK